MEKKMKHLEFKVSVLIKHFPNWIYLKHIIKRTGVAFYTNYLYASLKLCFIKSNYSPKKLTRICMQTWFSTIPYKYPHEIDKDLYINLI